MGFFKSLKDKMSDKNERVQLQHRHSESLSDRKHPYTSQPELSELQREEPWTEAYVSPQNLSSTNNPPPYESWLSVPDTSQLPPPPTVSNESSVANNASFSDAELGHSWCAERDIYTPAIPRQPKLVQLSQAGELGMDIPVSGFEGSISRLDSRSWEVRTGKRQRDTTLISTLPIYFAAISNPLLPTQKLSKPDMGPATVTFSFSIIISKLHHKAGIVIGFSCKPYPSFRLPGWHRGSLAVHSDDGNRYVNDPYGGIDFTQPFQIRDQVRMSMSIHSLVSPVQQYHGPWPDLRRVGSLPKCITKVQVERNGKVEGTWNVHEERDGEKDEGIEGLQGEADLYCAVGAFGMTSFVVQFEGQPLVAQEFPA